MVDFSLEGKIALITGGSRGIGEAIAMALAEQGAHCILISRKIEGLQAVREKIEARGGKADAIACHVGHMDQIENLFTQIEAKFGKLDILINNAATNPYFGEMIGADERAWNKTLEVNLKGPFFLTQYAAKLMEKGGGGAVVNVSSVVARQPGPMQGIYSITKAALVAMTQAYAKELAGKNIRVNALLPGVVDTKFSEALLTTDWIYEAMMKGVPLNRPARPDEMAGAVLYLVSGASSYTTGTTIVCDGGMLA
ncbi:MAG: SDR family oxidoreductase [Deltaproteobacteria bacterium]|jgi:NAD(P)-dependent dehydrogenase (short-subunit alcohol dehydrogenase family)|nr:SDR family oxidoreductase [Deltaproteobacteria bacterium]